MTVLFKPIPTLHNKFSSCRNYWGGGELYVCPPQYFHARPGARSGALANFSLCRGTATYQPNLTV